VAGSFRGSATPCYMMRFSDTLLLANFSIPGVKKRQGRSVSLTFFQSPKPGIPIGTSVAIIKK